YHGSADEAQQTAGEITAKGVKVALLPANFAVEEETAGLIGRAAAALGPLTALINSASLFENDDWQSATRQSWDAHMETNLRAPFLLSQLFAKQLPSLKDRGGETGNIINIIDQRVLKPTPQFISYSLSK